jgi:hypothetical protein
MIRLAWLAFAAVVWFIGLFIYSGIAVWRERQK